MSEDSQKSYRTAHPHAVTTQEICEALDKIEVVVSPAPPTYDEAYAMAQIVTEHTGELHNRLIEVGIVVEDYEHEISDMRELIEQASRYMSLGNFRQNVPRNTIKHFKGTMQRMNAIIALNKRDRREGSDDGRAD